MAAAALTSLSASPLLLGPPAAAFCSEAPEPQAAGVCDPCPPPRLVPGQDVSVPSSLSWGGSAPRLQGQLLLAAIPPRGRTHPAHLRTGGVRAQLQPEQSSDRTPACPVPAEPGEEPWPEPRGQPPGRCRSSSGDWGWDLASERSSPPTPSPPLPLETAHFLFGEPAPRKRKSAVRVLFQCLWKCCGKVLSTASGMQRHIRLAHLGRQAEPEQSDGEEDFYYTELDTGLEVLAPMSPTASLPPTFPHLGPPEPRALPSLLRPLALPPPRVLSPAAPYQACRSDHSYQGCLEPGRLQPPPSAGAVLPPKIGASLRKPRGDAKKCRKVYGMERRALWCTACRWKKACRRFLD